MSYLYTLPGCGQCDAARKVLLDTQEEYVEVAINNPLLSFGVQSAVGKVMAPILVRPDNQLYFLVEIVPGERKFVRLLV